VCFVPQTGLPVGVLLVFDKARSLWCWSSGASNALWSWFLLAADFSRFRDSKILWVHVFGTCWWHLLARAAPTEILVVKSLMSRPALVERKFWSWNLLWAGRCSACPVGTSGNWAARVPCSRGGARISLSVSSGLAGGHCRRCSFSYASGSRCAGWHTRRLSFSCASRSPKIFFWALQVYKIALLGRARRIKRFRAHQLYKIALLGWARQKMFQSTSTLQDRPTWPSWPNKNVSERCSSTRSPYSSSSSSSSSSSHHHLIIISSSSSHHHQLIIISSSSSSYFLCDHTWMRIQICCPNLFGVVSGVIVWFVWLLCLAQTNTQ